MSAPSLRRAGLTVIAFTIAGKIVGLVREMVVAATYGTSQVVDVYLAAITIPAAVGTILAQALPNAFVPLFTGADKLRRQSYRHALLLLGAMSVLSLGLWFAAGRLVMLTTSGFPTALQRESVLLFEIGALSVGAATIEALARSRLLARKRFVQPGVSGLWPSLVMIAALWLYPEGGSRTLTWGFVGGVGMTAFWNLLPLGRRRDPSVVGRTRETVAKQTPASGGWIIAVIAVGSTGLLYALIDRYFASFLAEGSIAAIQYASLVASPPVAICGLALSTAVFPYLSEALHRADHREAGQIADRAVRWALLGSVPVAVWLVFFGNEIVTVLFERGAFDADSRVITGGLLRFYGLWLVPAAVGSLLGRVFYAGRRWRPVLLAVMAGIVVKLALSLLLVETFRVTGLAAATVASALVATAVLLLALTRMGLAVSRIRWFRHAAALFAIFGIGSFLSAVAVSPVSGLAWGTLAYVRLFAGALLGGGALLMLGERMGIDEVGRCREWVKAAMRRRR